MAKFTFVTFNIKRKQNLLESIIKYVAKKAEKKYIIFGIQEMPARINCNVPKNVHLVVRADLAFIYSKKIYTIQGKFNSKNSRNAMIRKESMYLTIPLKTGFLQILNIHAVSKLNENVEKNKYLFQSIESVLGRYPNRIYLGDFNTNPYEENLISDLAIYSSREIEDVQKSSTKVSFYNPIWRYLRDKKGIKGTYCNREFVPRWQILDHILISKNLCKNKIYSFNILKEFSDLKIDLNKFEANNLSQGYSDHLPVTLTMEI